MRKSIFVAALAGVLIWAGVASAAPLTPTFDTGLNAAGALFGVGVGFGALSPGGTTAGEGAAPNTCIAPLAAGSLCTPPGFGPAAVQHLDWLVRNDGNSNGGFTYYYQVENSSVAQLSALNIASGNFVAVGFIAGVDLDLGIPAGTVISQTAVPPFGGGAAIVPNPPIPAAVPLHAGTVLGPTGKPVPFGLFANLDITDALDNSGDHESCGASCVGTPPFLGLVGPDAVFIIPGQASSFFFTGLDPGFESGVIVAQGSAPIYVNWNTAGAGNTWNNQQANPLGEAGRQVAAPGPRPPVIPEPSSLLLLGSGLAGLGYWGYRRKS